MKNTILLLIILGSLTSLGQSLTNERLSALGKSYQTANSQIEFTLGSISQTAKLFTVGVEDLDKEIRFNIYPNPSIDFVTIQNEMSYAYQYELVNPLGQTIRNGDVNRSQVKQLSISNLSKGLYYLKFYSDGKSVQSIKIIKQ